MDPELPDNRGWRMARTVETQRDGRWAWVTRHRRWAFALFALLLIMVASGVRVATLPIPAWNGLCSALERQDYADAYSLFSPTLRRDTPFTMFAHAAAEIDQVEGVVVGCSANWIAPSADALSGVFVGPFSVTIQRALAGNLSGAALFAWVNGGWTVDELDAGALGILPQALSVVDEFCADATGREYAHSYDLLGSQLQSAMDKTSFIAGARLQDAAEGQVVRCQVVTFARGNSDRLANLAFGIARSGRGEMQGDMTLARENGQWKITELTPDVVGFEIAPLALAQRFCAAVAKADYVAVLKMLVRDDTFSVGLANIQYAFQLPTGFRWTGCEFQLATYNVAGSLATVRAHLTLRATTGERYYVPIEIGLAREDDGWGLFFLRVVGA